MNSKFEIFAILLLLGFAYSNNLTTEPGNLKWSFMTRDYVTSSPAAYNDTIYVGSADWNLYALNYLDGGERWSFKAQGKIESSPLVYEGVVYFGVNDNNLYALNATNGSLLWKYATGGKIQSTPLIANNMVYFGSGDGNVYALDPKNGTLIWNYSTKRAIYSSPTFAFTNVYIGSTDGNLYAINAFVGMKIWSFKTGGPIYSSPAVKDFVVYFGSDDSRLYAINALNGMHLWNYSTSNKVQSTPSLSNDSIYVSSSDGILYALYIENASLRWSISSKEQIQSSPLYDNSTKFIYFGSADKNLYAINEKGEIVWKYGARDWILSKPASYKGLIYTGSYDGGIYAISTITTRITPFETEAVTGEVAFINGVSRADAGAEEVEVKIDNGDWEKAAGKESWSYAWRIGNLTEKRYRIWARTIDKNGNVETEPYNYTFVLVTKNASLTLKKMFVEFQERVNVAQPIYFVVRDEKGMPVPSAKLIMDSSAYYADENGTISKDANGLPIRIFREGIVNFTVVKEGYLVQSQESLLIMVVAEPVPTILYLLTAAEFILILVGVIVSYLIIKKFRKKPS